MFEYRITLPLFSNEGFDLEIRHQTLCHEACDLFGGCSYDNSQTSGMWVEPDDESEGFHIYKDTNAFLWVATDDLKALKAFVSRCGKLLDQKAMYVVKTGQAGILDQKDYV